MKDKVITILTSHDGLKQKERSLFAEYLDAIFSAAEATPGTAEKISALDARWEEMHKV